MRLFQGNRPGPAAAATPSAEPIIPDEGEPADLQRSISTIVTSHVTLSSSASKGVSLDFDEGKALSSGSYGSVFPGVLSYVTPQGEKRLVECVVKTYHNLKSEKSGAGERETNVLITRAIQNRSSSDAGLLRAITVFSTEDENHDVTEYLVLPKCQAILNKDYVAALQETGKQKPAVFVHVVFQILVSLVAGLETLKKLKLSHGDIKADNIGFREGVDGLLHACLLDYGTVKTFDALKNMLESGVSTFRGMPDYAAPETVVGAKYLKEVTPSAEDVWSLGLTILELFGQKPAELHGSPVGKGAAFDMQILFARGTAYEKFREKRDEGNEGEFSGTDAVGVASEYPASDAIRNLCNIMTSVLPEDRPTVETLKATLFSIAKQLPELSPEQRAEVDDFFRHPFELYASEEGAAIENSSFNIASGQTEETLASIQSTKISQDHVPDDQPAAPGDRKQSKNEQTDTPGVSDESSFSPKSR